MNIATSTQETPILGSYVKTRQHSYAGRVINVCSTFADTHADDEWFDGLRPRLPKRTKGEPWFGVLVHGGGAVWAPLSDLDVIAPFEFKNLNAAKYFGL